MLSRFRKSLVPMAVLCVSLASVASASATSATITSPGAKTATATTGSQLTITTASRTTATVNCATSTANSTLANASGNLPLTVSSDVSPTFGTCTLPGRVPVTVACTRTSVLKATALTDGSGNTAGSLSSISCSITLNATCGTNVTGTVNGSFANGTSQLTIAVAGQALLSTPISGSTCTTLPAGSGSFTNATGGALIYGVSPTTTVRVTNP
jgi:hypothetical protein